MIPHKPWKRAGWLLASLTAGGLALSPALAEQLSRGLLEEPILLPTVEPQILPFNKHVKFGFNGSFRVVVLTALSESVPNAQLVISRPDSVPSSDLTLTSTVALNLTSDAKGEVVVGGIEPGVYRVSIAAPEGKYEGDLWVWDPSRAPNTVRPVVAITLEPGPVSEPGGVVPPGPGGLSGLGNLPGGVSLGAAGLAGVAGLAGIAALSLALADEQIDVASP